LWQWGCVVKARKQVFRVKVGGNTCKTMTDVFVPVGVANVRKKNIKGCS
jgi:hypothetical protein